MSRRRTESRKSPMQTDDVRKEVCDMNRELDRRTLDLNQRIIKEGAKLWAGDGNPDAFLDVEGITWSGDRNLYLAYEREIRHHGLLIREKAV